MYEVEQRKANEIFLSKEDDALEKSFEQGLNAKQDDHFKVRRSQSTAIIHHHRLKLYKLSRSTLL